MAWTEIVDYTVPSTTASFTVTNFGTITKDDFVKIVMSTYVSSGTIVELFPNNQTTSTNYYRQRIETGGDGTGVYASRVNDARISQEVGVGNSITYLKLSENNKVNYFASNNSSNTSSSAIRFQYHYVTSTIDFASGITSLTFRMNGAFASGTRVQIYKLTAEKVVDLTTYSNTTQVDLTGFTIDKDSEYLLVSDVLNGATASSNHLYLTVNDNTTLTSYYRQGLIGNGSTVSPGRSNNPRIGVAYNSTNRDVLYTHIKLSEIGAFTAQSYQIGFQGSSSILIENDYVSSTAENITSITKLNLIGEVSNTLGAGSRFQLYKLY